MENSVDNKLPFLDVLVHFESLTFSTSVFRKNSFTGDYILYSAYSTMQQKINLISCLIYRALRLCSKEHLDDEMLNVKSIFLNLRYPDDII